MPPRLICFLLLACSVGHSFLTTPFPSSRSKTWMIIHAGTQTKPLYDGTNYTFPDTTTPAGIAELLEVSFVNACMQLRTGYVDVLKLFIAATIASYELGFPLEEIQKELSICPKQTANRPLMKEEEDLRTMWFCLVHLTLSAIGHTSRVGAVAESIPDGIRESYADPLHQIATAHKAGQSISVEELAAGLDPNLSEIERAVRSQSFRVATLTLVVLQDSIDARENDATQPPTPPIEGAF